MMISMREEIGGRPCDITKEGGKTKIVFHPMMASAKNPDATYSQLSYQMLILQN